MGKNLSNGNNIWICPKGLIRAISELSMAVLVLYIHSSRQKKRSFDVLSASFHTIFWLVVLLMLSQIWKADPWDFAAFGSL